MGVFDFDPMSLFLFSYLDLVRPTSTYAVFEFVVLRPSLGLA